MALPPEVLLEPEDNEVYKGMLRALTQMKRGLSLKVGKLNMPQEDMHMAKSLQNLLGDSPSQTRMALVTAQGQVTREKLLKAVHALEEKAFDTVSAFETFASKIQENSEESIGDSPKEKDNLKSQGDEKGLERRDFIKKVGARGIFGTALLATTTGTIKATGLPFVKEVNLKSKQVDSGAQNGTLRELSFVQVSDLHVGPTIRDSLVEKISEEIKKNANLSL